MLFNCWFQLGDWSSQLGSTYANIDVMLNHLNYLNLQQMLDFEVVKLIHKIKLGLMSPDKLINANSDIHKYATRRAKFPYSFCEQIGDSKVQQNKHRSGINIHLHIFKYTHIAGRLLYIPWWLLEIRENRTFILILSHFQLQFIAFCRIYFFHNVSFVDDDKVWWNTIIWQNME